MYPVAFYSLKEPWTNSKQEIKSHLSNSLPDYMIPSYFVELDKVPITSSGKVNRKLLPEISGENVIQKEYVPPRTEKEKELIQIWQEVLGLDKIGITDDFFELGGDSLKSIRLITEIQSKLNYEYLTEDIYNYPTILKLSNAKDTSSKVYFGSTENEKNIFFIPGIIGRPLVFKFLSKKLSADYNCIGLKYKGLNSGDSPLDSIEEIASYFCDEIIAENKGDELILFSFSFGGLVGFEMMKTLEKRYQKIHFMVVDTPIQDDTFDTLKMNESFEFLQNMINEYCKGGVLDVVQKEHLETFVKHNLKLKKDYKQKGLINSKIVIFESREKNDTSQNFKGWTDYTNNEIEIQSINGTHSQALHEFNFEYFINKINNI